MAKRESCKRLVSTVQSISLPVKIQKIVAFACGSFERDAPLQSSRVSFQHALVLTLRALFLKDKHVPASVACYAQDPDYSAIDRLILSECGIEVVNDPDGFIILDDSTIVLACLPEAPVKQIIADIAKPAIIIWDRVDLEDPVDSL